MTKKETLRVQCAWCLREKIGEKWYERQHKDIEATHSICPPCKKALLAEVIPKRKENAGPLIGASIVDIRPAMKSEKKALMWHDDFMVVELDSGALLFASSDDEMNEAGTLNYSLGDKIYTLTKKR